MPHVSQLVRVARTAHEGSNTERPIWQSYSIRYPVRRWGRFEMVSTLNLPALPQHPEVRGQPITSPESNTGIGF